MKILYSALFLGQGFSVLHKSVVDVVSERGKTVMLAQNDRLIGVFEKHFIEKIKEI